MTEWGPVRKTFTHFPPARGKEIRFRFAAHGHKYANQTEPFLSALDIHAKIWS